jgi:hypothetical protein
MVSWVLVNLISSRNTRLYWSMRFLTSSLNRFPVAKLIRWLQQGSEMYLPGVLMKTGSVASAMYQLSFRPDPSILINIIVQILGKLVLVLATQLSSTTSVAYSFADAARKVSWVLALQMTSWSHITSRVFLIKW